MKQTIRSMTGVGVASASNDEFEISVKVQGVNSRYLDTNFRMPSIYNEFEAELRQVVRSHVARGKVDAYFDIRDMREDAVQPILNKGVVSAYLQAADQLPGSDRLNRTVSAADVLGYHQALRLEPREISDRHAFTALLVSVLESALEQFSTARETEGSRMLADMRQRIERCGRRLDVIEDSVELIREEYKEKMRERLAELMEMENLDEGRLEQEAAHLIDKSDITEEIVRFRSHLERFEELVSDSGEKGKKLDFLLQELNRETNTIGSKSKNIEISRQVVDIKSELEKIREQVQNIE